MINLIDINYDASKAFGNISNKSKTYIENCFKTAVEIMHSGYTYKFINGPISKDKFLNKKYPGITEYLAKKK